MELDLLKRLTFEIVLNWDFQEEVNGLQQQITKIFIFTILILFKDLVLIN